MAGASGDQASAGASVQETDRASGDAAGRIGNLSHRRPGCDQNPSFTPDGHRVVSVAQRCEQCTEGIWSMSLRGHDRRRLVASPPGLHAEDPNVSPDGELISFVAENEQNRAGL